jgi:hypothetical protein
LRDCVPVAIDTYGRVTGWGSLDPGVVRDLYDLVGDECSALVAPVRVAGDVGCRVVTVRAVHLSKRFSFRGAGIGRFVILSGIVIAWE